MGVCSGGGDRFFNHGRHGIHGNVSDGGAGMTDGQDRKSSVRITDAEDKMSPEQSCSDTSLKTLGISRVTKSACAG